MARFNSKSATTKTTNLAGGKAYIENPKLELVSLLLTSFVKDKFYESADDQLIRLRSIVASIPDKKFVAKAAIYARTKFGMRSITHALAGEIGNLVKGQTWTKDFFSKVVFRPDDITEIISYTRSNFGKVIPNSMKKGLGSALSSFNEYTLAKYRMENRDMKMVDVVNLIHPKNTPALKKLVYGKLKSKETWEAKLSKAGQIQSESDEDVEEAKAGAWKELVESGKIGQFALLRNLRNILQQAPEIIPQAVKLLTDEKRTKGSLILPFRFATAYREIEQLQGPNVSKVLAGISDALDTAVQNVPAFEGNTLTVLDDSGSMGSGEKDPWGIGSLFAAVIAKRNGGQILLFSDRTKWVNVNPKSSTLDIVRQLGQYRNGGGTDFHLIPRALTETYDRIIILSDMQGWMEGGAPTKTFNEYKKRCRANPKIYSFDLNGYGTLMFPENNVFCLAGWSEKVFDLMKYLEEDRNAMVNEIEKVELA